MPHVLYTTETRFPASSLRLVACCAFSWITMMPGREIWGRVRSRFAHATNEGGYISWYDFTKEIYRQAGYKTEVIPVTTEEYGLSKAARPFNSRLDKSKLVEAGFVPLPTWQDALSRYLKEIEA